MGQILQGLKGVQCNQDDMIITGKDNQENLENLRAVLYRLPVHGLKANLEKCQFLRDEVIFWIVHTKPSPCVSRPSETVTTPEPSTDSTLSETSKQSG
ncbi:transposon tf2-9 polyprotein [Plakobranchus ocellatus]|uniref:Transposon tf2-9 polyprotein n=1 Tax=Plakobranchus ocellatus TaxID=259542 RepID=A0AAV3YXS1_9GAST|nr:transposon tf2-9 polyprotein [Plakobranchus ocellatus]